jgi:tripartite-type tricarboxylate transporter receptor subunit TctC
MVAMSILLLLGGMLMAGGTDESSKAAGVIFPERNIDVVVHSSAGGGSDVWARKVSALMEPHLGVQLVVTNKPGGNGGVAANYVWNQPHDGYTLVGASETSMTYAVNGAFEQGARAWHYFWSGGSPGVIVVKADSPFKSFEEYVRAAQATPNDVTIAVSGIGKLWHLKAEMVDKYGKVPIKDSPYKGSAPAIVALLSGEVDSLSCSAGEAAPYIKSGEMRPLIMTEDYSYTFDGYAEEVRGVTAVFPDMKKYLPMSQGLCLLVPNDIPDAVFKILGEAFDKAMSDPEMEAFIEQQAAVKIAMWGKEADQMAVDMEARFSWFAQDLGVAQVSPEELGIKKP